MNTTYRLQEQLKITIKRPSGKIETVFETESVRSRGLNEKIQARCVKATKDAGKGDILSFEIVDIEVPMSIREQRDLLTSEINNAIYFYKEAREKDFENDIGMHISPGLKKHIDAAIKELADFDLVNKELADEIKKEKDAEIKRNIQSALNA